MDILTITFFVLWVGTASLLLGLWTRLDLKLIKTKTKNCNKLFYKFFKKRHSTTNKTKSLGNFLDITPRYGKRERSSIDMSKGFVVSSKETEEKMSEAAQQALDQISILRKLVQVQPVDKVKTISSVVNSFLVTYNKGKVSQADIKKKETVSVPLTLHYYSLPANSESYELPNVYNVTLGWECGIYLSTIENCILIQSLKFFEKTKNYYNVEDYSELYRAHLDLKKSRVKAYSMILKESFKAIEDEYFNQLFEELQEQPEIHLIYVPDKFLEYFSITSILIEIDKLSMCLTEKTPVKIEAVEYPRQGTFAQAIIEIGIAMAGSPNIIFCYDKEDYLVSDSAFEFLRSL